MDRDKVAAWVATILILLCVSAFTIPLLTLIIALSIKMFGIIVR